MAKELEGKIAIVTGAGRGLGRAVALLFANQGAKVVVADNGSSPDGSGANSSPANDVVSEIRKRGGEAFADFGDVSDTKSAALLIDRAIATWGKLDILVNAAGNIRPCTITDISESDFDNVVRIHLRGTFNTSHFASKHWVQRKTYGRLINFGSKAGLEGFPTLLSYSSAKSGIFGFTQACANALVAYRVTANVIIPSAVTRMAASTSSNGLGWVPPKVQGDSLREGQRDEDNEREPASVAPLVAFLASEKAEHISGRVFGAYGSRYTRWSMPYEECEMRLNSPDDFERALSEFDRVLGADVKLQDLPYPMRSLESWRSYVLDPPRWDFKTPP